MSPAGALGEACEIRIYLVVLPDYGIRRRSAYVASSESVTAVHE
jgi:hypothetical protein